MFMDADLPGRETDLNSDFFRRAWHQATKRGNPKMSGDYSDTAAKSSKAQSGTGRDALHPKKKGRLMGGLCSVFADG
jgi:hypothetical protein